METAGGGEGEVHDLDVAHGETDVLDFLEGRRQVLVQVQQVALQHNLTLPEDVTLRQFVPDLEVLPPLVVLKEVYFLQLVVNLFLLVPVVESEKLAGAMLEVDDSPGRHGDVLVLIFAFVLHDVPVVAVLPPVQVAELLLHLGVILHQADEVVWGQHELVLHLLPLPPLLVLPTHHLLRLFHLRHIRFLRLFLLLLRVLLVDFEEQVFLQHRVFDGFVEHGWVVVYDGALLEYLFAGVVLRLNGLLTGVGCVVFQLVELDLPLVITQVGEAVYAAEDVPVGGSVLAVAVERQVRLVVEQQLGAVVLFHPGLHVHSGHQHFIGRLVLSQEQPSFLGGVPGQDRHSQPVLDGVVRVEGLVQPTRQVRLLPMFFFQEHVGLLWRLLVVIIRTHIYLQVILVYLIISTSSLLYPFHSCIFQGPSGIIGQQSVCPSGQGVRLEIQWATPAQVRTLLLTDFYYYLISMDTQEDLLLDYLSRFHLSMSMVKICARQCGLLSQSLSHQLSQQQTNCIAKCSSNIEQSYSGFHTKFAAKKIFGDLEEESDLFQDMEDMEEDE